MNRRTLLQRLLAGAAAIVGTGVRAPSAVRAEASTESQRVQALHDDMLANPEQYPELWARVRQIMGDSLTVSDGLTITGNSILGGECADCARIFAGELVPPKPFVPVPGATETARRAVHEMALRDGISHDEAALLVYWQAFPTYGVVEPLPIDAPTFEAMAADCGARGCWLESQYDISRAATLVHHWPSDRTSMTRPDEIYVDRLAAIDAEEQIDVWRRSLHEQADVLAFSDFVRARQLLRGVNTLT